jgi:hypothetical protein
VFLSIAKGAYGRHEFSFSKNDMVFNVDFTRQVQLSKSQNLELF